MYKPLLILITLLVATQSYAQSVKFEFRARASSKYPNLNNSSVFVTSSMPLFKYIRQNEIIEHENGVRFETDQPLFIPREKNEDQLEQLMSILKRLTQTDQLKTKADVFLMEKISYTMESVAEFVERVMIKHGYSVTIREKTGEQTRAGNYDFIWQYYFFKP